MEAVMGICAGAAPALPVGKWPSRLCLACSVFQVSRNHMIGFYKIGRQDALPIHSLSNQGRRNYSICAVGGKSEKSLQSTMEIDILIDKLRVTDERKLPELVAENILAFDSAFWVRLAARTDFCESQDDKEDLEELASSLMSMVDCYVQKTQEKIESATDVLKAILNPITNEDEEIVWPPKNPESLNLMKKELGQREQEGQLDESFLSEVSAQLRQAKIDKDKPGLVAILQKVLQLYASRWLSRRSYAEKGIRAFGSNIITCLMDTLYNHRYSSFIFGHCSACYPCGKIIKAEEFLETIVKADEEDWNRLLLTGLTYGGGPITIDDLIFVIDKRVERTLMRTQGGSYQQRVLCEYLKEIKSRAEDLVEAFQNPQAS